MSRVQLALNVSDLEPAVDFYSKLFATEPAKRRPGYANFAIAEPPLKLVLIEGVGQPGSLNHLGVEVESPTRSAQPTSPPHRRGPGDGHRGRGGLLLRRAGQGLGRRPRRRALGDLHRPRRRGDAAGRAPHGRPGRGRATPCAARRPPSPPAAAAEPPVRRPRPAATAEAVGTAFLVAVVVGSGIAAQRLSPDDVGLQLLENSIATGAGLVALILAFGSVSGAHFNPVVSLADRVLGGLSTREPVGLRRRAGRGRLRRGDGRQPHVRAAGRELSTTSGPRAGSGSARSSPPSACSS